MNKIIVLGHPQSGFERVEGLLNTCGMAQALPSRREGFSPKQISDTLVKAHGAVPVQHVCKSDELQQIAVAPVWQGLALDLVLANMDQPLWGWADAQAVYLLDYWKAQDPQTMFVLVYDAPQTALTRHAVEHLETNPEALQAKVNAWVAYNSALLSFHLRNPERSLLVHVDQVQASATNYVQQLSARMDAPLQLPSASQGPFSTSAADDGTHDDAQPMPQAEAAAASIVHADTHAPTQPGLQGNPLAQWLAQQLLQEHSAAQELYAQLQAAASMPLREHHRGNSLLVGHDLQQQHYQAWTAFVAQQTAMQQSATRLAQLGTTLQDRQQQLQHSHRQIEQLQQTQRSTQQRVQEQEQLLSKHTAALQTSEQENELLLSQLHKVQEELESRYLQSQEQAKKLAEMPKLQADLKSAQEKASKLQDAEVQLKKELQQAPAKPAFTKLQEENELLLSQLHKVQEELESRYLQSQEQAKKLAEMPKLQADLKSAQEKASKLQDAEVQLKKELQQAPAKPAFTKLQEENELLLSQLHKVQEELESRYLQSQEQAKKLAEMPKLQADLKSAQEKASKLQDAEVQLKKELQQAPAKPAFTKLQEENELLLSQLHKVQEELERYYLENRQLKAQGLAAQPKAYYGAADRVKQQLSYRLGATMIAQSRTVGGWLRMPFALNAEIKRFKQDQAALAHQKLPPIAQYRDAHEAERVKQHLSYRLGARMISNSKTLGGWVAMPWALLGETKAFRKDRQSH